MSVQINSSGGGSLNLDAAVTDQSIIHTLPAASGTIVLHDESQTLTNKTFTNPLMSSINSGPLTGFRNAIINGNFDHWQRGTSFLNPAVGAYTTDRWMVVYDGSGATRTLSRQAFTLGQIDVPGEPTYFFRFAQSVAGSGGNFNAISQRIESVRTFAGQQVTLSFYAKAAAALTLPLMAFRQTFGSGGSPSTFVDTYTGFGQVITTSWTRYSFTITMPSISGKTLGTDNNDNMEVFIFLPINTTFTFDITQVQLELGPIATPFERRPPQTELALCQRYYQNSGQAANRDSALVFNANIYKSSLFPVSMRAAPSLTLVPVSGSIVNPVVNQHGFYAYCTQTVGAYYIASAEL